ncbi:MAG: hypothetical protein PHS65_03860 [Arcobacteraceae bacterium]|nr:hypothetical protein [Arcobacteraceae bacterium]
MITCLKIKLDKKIPTDNTNSVIDNIVLVEEVRDNIIKFSSDEPESLYRLINNQDHSLPCIVYAKPYEDTIKVYGLGDDGLNGINAIFKNVVMNQTFKIKNEIYKIKGFPIVENNIDLLPYSNGRENVYTTITPINIFNRFNHKVFKAILYKHFKDGNFDSNQAENVKSFYKEIAAYVNEQIRDSIAYMVSKILKKEKEYFEFVSKIEIDWDDIKIIHGKYHSEEKKMPMVIGKFRCNFVLPKFIGYKIGKGFGELSLKDSCKI